MINTRRIKGQGGMTFVEVLIASIILSVLIGAVFETFSAGMLAYNTSSVITQQEGMLHIRVEKIMSELWETNPAYVWVSSFNDTNFATPQEILVFLSARNTQGTFISANGQPVWQRIMCYCPYAYVDAQGRTRRELKQYISNNIPAVYLKDGFVFTANLTANQISLPGGITFNRSEGNTLLGDLNDFDITGNYPLRLSIQVLARTPKADVPVTLTSELAARNKN